MNKIDLKIVKGTLILLSISLLYYSVIALSNFFEFADLYGYSFFTTMYLNSSLILPIHLLIAGYLIVFLFLKTKIVEISAFKIFIAFYLFLEVLFLFLTDIAFYQDGYDLILAYPFYIQRTVLYSFYFLVSDVKNSVLFISKTIKNIFIPIPIIYLLSLFIYGYQNLGYDLIAFVRDLILVGGLYYLIFNSNIQREV